MKLLTITSIVALSLMASCYAEWDVPAVPRHDRCTGKTETSFVYVNPRCPNAPALKHPNDSTPQFVNERRY